MTCMSFILPSQWKKLCGGQQTEQRSAKRKCTTNLGKLSASGLHDWNKNYTSTSWLEILKDAAAVHEGWQSHWRILPTESEWKMRAFVHFGWNPCVGYCGVLFSNPYGSTLCLPCLLTFPIIDYDTVRTTATSWTSLLLNDEQQRWWWWFERPPFKTGKIMLQGAPTNAQVAADWR